MLLKGKANKKEQILTNLNKKMNKKCFLLVLKQVFKQVILISSITVSLNVNPSSF